MKNSLALPAALMLFFSFLFFIWIPNSHAPLSDDLSMIAYSKDWSWDWLNKGLADYFIVYPEYYGPQSNFIRPVSNFVYWIFGAIFVENAPFLANQIQLLILTYGMLVGVSASVFFLSSQVQTSRSIATLALLACIFIPTFWTTPTPTYTSFVFDGLAILLCLLALIAFYRHHSMLMTLCLSLAMMTKEIAFPVLLGFTFSFILTRNIRALIGCIFAIMLFAALRLNGFGFDAAGVYVFDTTTQSLFSVLHEKFRNLLSLPFGPVFYVDIITSSGISIINRSALLLVINVSIYALAAFAFSKFIVRITPEDMKSIRYGRFIRDPRTSLILIASLSTFMSLLFDAYVGANYRYAFNLLPFLFIAMAGIPLHPNGKRIVFATLFGGSVIASAPSLARLHNDFEIEKFRYQIVRDLFDVLHLHKNAKHIVILNDFVLGYANPEALEILVPFNGQIDRGTSLYLDGCSRNDLSKIETKIETHETEIHIRVALPECGRFTFESSPKLPEFVTKNIIRRNDVIHYEFNPDQESAYLSVPGWSGRDLTIVTRDVDLLYFDFSDNNWKFIRGQKL